MGKPVYVEFGAFRLDPARRVLLQRGKPVSITAKAFDMLLFMVQNSGRLLEKDELLDAVWPDAVVEESNLAVTVAALRKVLGEPRNGHHYIVTAPKRGYRFVAAVSGLRDAGPELPSPAAGPLAPRERRVRFIAVLPLRALSPDDGDVQLGLGIAEALITRLSQHSEIVVRPITRALQRQSVEDVAALGRRIGVKALLDGTVQRVGDKVRATARLVRVRDGTLVCAYQFDEAPGELFALADTLAERITRALLLRLNSEDQQRLRGQDTASTKAYHAYLKGRFFWERRTEESFNRGITCFEQAIDEDPGYASAYLGLADCYHLLAYFGAQPPAVCYPRVTAAALKALEYDASLGVAHTTLGCVHLLYGWDAAQAVREFHLALELDPEHPRVHHWSSQCSLAIGDFEAAMRALERARALDPMSVMINTNIALGLFWARRYDESIAELRRTIEIEPHFGLAHWALGINYQQKGAYEDAVRELQKGLSLSGTNVLMLSALGHTYGVSGQRAKARKILDELRRLSTRRYVSPYCVGVVHAGLGDTDQAFDWLQKAVDDRTTWLVYLGVDPTLDRLRSDRRFPRLVRRIGLGHDERLRAVERPLPHTPR